jgi:hypothetical protein
MTCKNAKQARMWEKMFQFILLQTNIVKLKIKKRTRAHRQSETDEKTSNFQAGRHSGSSSERVFRFENNRHKGKRHSEPSPSSSILCVSGVTTTLLSTVES